MNAPDLPPDGSRWRNKNTGNVVVIVYRGTQAYYRSERDVTGALSPALPWTFAILYEPLQVKSDE